MNINEKITAYNENKKALLNEAKVIKSELEKYFSDKSVPLSERWELFLKTNVDFKNHTTSIYHGKTKGMKYVMTNWFNAPEIYGRGKQVFIAERFEECIHEGVLYPENFCYKTMRQDSEELLIETLEEILSENLGSFCFDW